MDSQPVVCPNCDAPIRAADINIAALVAKCPACDHISKLPEFAGDAAAEFEQPPGRPSGVRDESDRHGELCLRLSWFNPGLFFLLFFCIAWDAFLVFWYSMAFFVEEKGEEGFNWIMVVFPIGHVAVGVCLTYYVIAGFLNKTRIKVQHRSVTVRHGPIPWLGNREIRRSEIIGIETDDTHSNNGLQHSTVSAHLADSSLKPLVSSIRDDQADYVAWRLAECLEVECVRRNRGGGDAKMPAWLSRFMPARPRR